MSFSRRLRHSLPEAFETVAAVDCVGLRDTSLATSFVYWAILTVSSVILLLKVVERADIAHRESFSACLGCLGADRALGALDLDTAGRAVEALRALGRWRVSRGRSARETCQARDAVRGRCCAKEWHVFCLATISCCQGSLWAVLTLRAELCINWGRIFLTVEALRALEAAPLLLVRLVVAISANNGCLHVLLTVVSFGAFHTT